MDFEMEEQDANADEEEEEETPKQFGELVRKLVVSYPAVSPDVNMHVWEAAGKAMPLIPSRVVSSRPGSVGSDKEPEKTGDDQDGGEDDNDEEEQQELSDASLAPNGPASIHTGAGHGLISSVGSSLNHVVALSWSPPNLARNNRSVLGVLTAHGTLVIYGEGAPFPFGSTVKPWFVTDNGRVQRNLKSWLALWAVGENHVVPGQETYGEFVKAFAWAGEVGEGRAVVGYVNDAREIVVLGVGYGWKVRDDGVEEAVWWVREAARFEMSGPHGDGDVSLLLFPVVLSLCDVVFTDLFQVSDPDYVPSGSSYSIRFSPWVKGDKSWTCLVSYMDRNYVGFKKITINVPSWKAAEAPIITCDSKDWEGRCIYLGPDAFLEFEDTVSLIFHLLNKVCAADEVPKIFEANRTKLARGIIATPLEAIPFEVNLTRAKPSKAIVFHPTDMCNTTFSPSSSSTVTNPITGLILHFTTTSTAPSLTPLYTAVRLSATPTNTTTLYETNLPNPHPPQWATELTALLSQTQPHAQASRLTTSTAPAPREKGLLTVLDPADVPPEESDDDSDDDDSQAWFDPWANEGADVHPWRAKVWGIAKSPGGGASVVLVSVGNAIRPEAEGAGGARILFGCTPREGKKDQSGAMDLDGAVAERDVVEGLSTEARMFEWMYGGGPLIPGLTPKPETNASQEQPNERQRRNAKIRSLFKPFVDATTCAICADGKTKLIPRALDGSNKPVSREERHLDCECENGHCVAVCGLSGLAIMEAGISRVCGVCGARVVRSEVLREKWLVPNKLDMEAVEEEVCPCCGGKWLD